MVQFTDLPTDIVDQILACLPDFQTLAAAIKVSKEHTYNVFQEHRQTILTSVGLNLVGSSLIHALRVALCQNRFGISVDLNYEESLDAATEFLASLTLGQRRFLEDNAVAVQALEDVYSQIYKDRCSRTSVLSDAESTRFRTALYRVWLLCWAACAEEEEEEPEDVDDEEEGAQENGNWADIVARLVKYDTPELQDIIAATSFLQVMFQRVMSADPHNVHIQNFMFLPSPDRIGNPGLVYEWLRDNTWREPSEGVELSATTFNHIILDKVCLLKNLDKETTLAVGPQRFIVQVNGVDDTCFGCNEVHGADLYGRANWNLLAGTIGFASIKDWLPGNLSRNTVETRAVFDIISAEVDSDWNTFTEEIFDVQETDEEEVWDKEQWYCKTCITKLFRTRFPKWWMARPQNANTPVKDDCWYGWNCRTQIHRLRHAQNLNHFCEPSRDDGKTPAEAWTHGN